MDKTVYFNGILNITSEKGGGTTIRLIWAGFSPYQCSTA